MKKSILTLAIVVFGSILAFAQNDNQKTSTVNKTYNGQGFQDFDIFVTGAAAYKSQDDVATTGAIADSNILTLSPKVGYFLTSELALGLDFSYTSSKFEFPIDISEGKEIGVGVFGRYYFVPQSKFSVFGQANVNYLNQQTEFSRGTRNPLTQEVTYIISKSKANGFGFGLSAGANYFLNTNFALETSVGFLNYNSLKPDFPGATKSEGFNVGLDMANISLGLLYRL